MPKFILNKCISLLVMVFLISLLIFGILYALPGDPAQIILGIHATPESLSALRFKMGLDQSLWVQYTRWIESLITFHPVLSIQYQVPVSQLIMDRIWITIPLSLIAMGVTLLIAFPLGIYAAIHHGEKRDLAVISLTQAGMILPEFWLAILLMMFLSVHLGWFQTGGFPGWGEDFIGSFKALILPALSLGMIRGAILTRVIRSALLDVLETDYVRCAWAKGLKRHRVLYIHALKNAMIPILTVMALQFGQLLSGAIIIENVFYLPGLGRLILQAIAQRDFPVVREVVLFLALSIVLVHFVVDILFGVLNPKIREGWR